MTHRIALLVDGDNISATHACQIRQIAATAGRVDIARVYGNAQTARGWPAADGFRFLHAGTGKNATDLLLTIDAMELALTAGIEGFVLVTSDGDFTHLAQRLREHGLTVDGIGETKAPRAFQAACSIFHQLEPAAPRSAPKLALVVTGATATPPQAALPDLCHKVREIIRETGTGKDGMKIADLNAAIRAVHPVNISKQPEKTWRRYLLARPNLFDVDDPGPNARVRLRDTVARSAQRLANT